MSVGRRPTLRCTAALLLVILAIPGMASAQDCPAPATIAADRPGNLTAPFVLPAGRTQVEAGWARTRSGDVDAQTIASTLVRVGLSCWAELRLASGGWTRQAGPGPVTAAIADAWVGTKLRLQRGGGARPHLGLFLGTLVPTHSIFSHRSVEPEASLSALWELPHGQSLLAFGGLASRANGDARVGERLSGISWGFPIGALASFVEYSEFARPGATARYLGTGVQFFPRATVQLDASLLVPVPRPGSDLAIGLGLSRRW